MSSDNVILMENPRRRRRRRKATSRKRRPVRRRRRRRNPAAVAKPRRRRAPARRRRRSNPAHIASHRKRTTKRRRSNPRRAGIGRLLSARRMMNIVTDASGFVISEFAGDAGARFIWNAEFMSWYRNGLFQTGLIGTNPELGVKWTQLILAVVGGPMIRQARIIPKPVAKYWEISNAAGALVGLTWQWRQQAHEAMGLAGYSHGMRDWVTTPAAAAAPAIAPAADNNNNALSDWATVGSSASYTGDPFSM